MESANSAPSWWPEQATESKLQQVVSEDYFHFFHSFYKRFCTQVEEMILSCPEDNQRHEMGMAGPPGKRDSLCAKSTENSLQK